MDDISIERLVLNMPGLATEQARELAQSVGRGLAANSVPPGCFGTLTVELNDRAMSQDIPRLANAIVTSLLRQIG